jgi:hypothetical protein
MEIRDRRRGFLWINNEIVDDFAPQLGSMSLLVYMYLCRHANNDTAVCWPSQERIAHFCHCTDRTVRSALKELEDIGLISIERRRIGDITQNIYTLLSCEPSGKFFPVTPPPTGNLRADQPETTDPLTRLNKQDLIKHKTFVRPSIEEISRYCQERKNKVDPEKWLDYYIANGFRVGRNAMKDWKASVRLWERNGFTNGNGGNGDHHKTPAQLRNERISASIERAIRKADDSQNFPTSLFKGNA